MSHLLRSQHFFRTEAAKCPAANKTIRSFLGLLWCGGLTVFYVVLRWMSLAEQPAQLKGRNQNNLMNAPKSHISG